MDVDSVVNRGARNGAVMRQADLEQDMDLPETREVPGKGIGIKIKVYFPAVL